MAERGVQNDENGIGDGSSCVILSRPTVQGGEGKGGEGIVEVVEGRKVDYLTVL